MVSSGRVASQAQGMRNTRSSKGWATRQKDQTAQPQADPPQTQQPPQHADSCNVDCLRNNVGVIYDVANGITAALVSIADVLTGGGHGGSSENEEEPAVTRSPAASQGVPDSIPAGPSARPTAAQQRAINEMGDAHGCSTCGTTNPGTKSGNWVGDHQPPTSQNPPGGA